MNDRTRYWSAGTEQILRKAGWHPGREVSTEEWRRALLGRGGIDMSAAARGFLAEFGGLVVAGDAGRFRIDPLTADWDDKVFDVPGEGSPAYLYPVGATDRGDGVGVAPSGAVYIGRESVRLLAPSLGEALDRLVSGEGEGEGGGGDAGTYGRTGTGKGGGPELRSRWSALTKRVLRSSGWDPDRWVLRPEWESELRERGFPVHEAARRFLAEFGGLRTDEWTPGPVMPQSPYRFDPLSVPMEIEAFARFSDTAGEDLCPIGRADNGDSYLGMAANGAVYVGTDRAELLADNGYDAVEKLVMERRTDAPLPFVLVGGHLVLPHSSAHDLSAEIGTRWSAETDRVLRLAGWCPGRSVSTEEWERRLHAADEDFEIHEAARGFLREFGGLEIHQRGPGRTAARSPFRLDPLVAEWDCEIFDDLGERAGKYLYPIGGIGRGVSYLGMAVDGTVHAGMDNVEFLAETGDEALRKLIEGVR
ncbi:SUKH-3 domain-containing protein [Streptomyces sp. NRRL S-920]|uniref:SUKH-3 domain-containing protein n=1 Tax=Streptomyces sp. NRRL S-920 TaxID=1463921 RepID=UPI00099713C2|nr:SUKH-3 domain-containing protein [Streptomyces sp. NRRL S-920]